MVGSLLISGSSEDFHARIGEQDLTLPTRKTQALLAYLAVRPGQAHLRDKLAAVLWSGAGKSRPAQLPAEPECTSRCALSRSASDPHGPGPAQ